MLGATARPGPSDERALRHPFFDDDEPPPCLNTPVDPMGVAGNVRILPEPFLGCDANWDCVSGHRVD